MMLTEIKIKNLPIKEKSYTVFDGKGLYIHVYSTGSKIWRRVHVENGRQIRKSLGPWPLVSLRTARELNDKAVFERKTGLAESKLPAPAPTMADIVARWRAKFLPSLAPATVKKLNLRIDNHILPKLGACKIGDVTSELVLRDLLLPIESLGHNETAHQVRSLLSRILRFAMASGHLDRDVAAPLGGALAPVKTIHRPTITDLSRVGRLILDIRNYSGKPVVAAALRMLPYVFVRPGELRHAQWDEFDFDNGLWRIPAERMKMRAAHVVPLSSQVVDLLTRLKAVTGNCKHLFPGRNLKTQPISEVTINAALRYLGYGNDEICGHGFRAMASTILNERGYNSDWIERQLAHVERNGVRAAYNHADWLPERRKMMQDWADLLDALADEAAQRSSVEPDEGSVSRIQR